MAGTYTVTVTDTNGCSITKTVTINEPTVVEATVTAINATCNSMATGSATVSATGGTGSYTYHWNTTPVQTTATAQNLLAGTYTVTVTDTNGCSITKTVTINEPTVVEATVTAINATCNSMATGSATVSATGGTGSYTYHWNTVPVQTTATAQNLLAGTYTVTVTDTNGCSITKTVTINEPTVVEATVTATNATCNSMATGSATVSATGGTGTYSYHWNTVPVQTTATAQNLLAGTYTVTVTDTNGCSITKTVTINEPTVVEATVTAINATCNSMATGSATVSATGGTGSYTYHWNTVPVQTTATAQNLLAGTYTVTVTDSNGCSITKTVTINEPTVVEATVTANNETCNSMATGSATVSATGGTGSYTYHWNTVPVQTTATAQNLLAGTYTVTVTDTNGCSITKTVTINEPTVVEATVTATNATCNSMATGSATVSATGGTGSYTYHWNTVPVQTTATAQNLLAGTYTVTVTDSNGCSITKTVTINEPTVVEATVTAINATCNNMATGSATVSATGGTGSYTYHWNTVPVQTTATAQNLLAGTYTVTVTDTNGCSITKTVTINEPTVVEATVTAINATCNSMATGSATVSATGGTGSYTYHWNTVPVQTTATAQNLLAGTYTVTVTDSNGCSITKTVTINEPTVVEATVTANKATCNSMATGSATVSATGGTGSYTYHWNTVPVQTTATAQNLLAGTYTVTVTDANGCSITKTVTINEPTVVEATVTAINATCNSMATGSATVSATGGTGSYTYHWNTVPVQTTATAQNLLAGTYTVTVTDTNGCSITKTVTINEPTVVEATVTAINATCNSMATGSATVSATGGTESYTYHWNTVPVQTTATAQNLLAGTYTVTVTDTNGCSITKTVTINEPTVVEATVTAINATCNSMATGSATVSATGGTGSYTYHWNTVPVQTTATAQNLLAGTYTVTVTDANGCSITKTVTINEPTVVEATVTAINATCNNMATGSATVSATGGTGSYTYHWNTVPVQTTATAQNLLAGTYTVTVTDTNGCSITKTVTINEPTVVEATVTATNATCNSMATGSATVSATGGTGSYTYHWNTVPVQTTATAQNLLAGTYTVTVTDTNGCSITKTVTINEPTVVEATVTAINATCNSMATGSATVSATGGTGSYTYHWNTVPVQTTATAQNLLAGTYTVTVTDTNGCSITKTVTINEPTVVEATVTAINATCNSMATGSATVSATGGTGSYTYHWNTVPVQTTATAQNLLAGTYTVTVTDTNGCSITKTVTINEPTVVEATVTATNATCNSMATGSATVSATGGTESYTYHWNTVPVQTTATAQNLLAGTYTVTVTDTNGCSITKTVTINEPTVVEATVTAINAT